MKFEQLKALQNAVLISQGHYQIDLPGSDSNFSLFMGFEYGGLQISQACDSSLSLSFRFGIRCSAPGSKFTRMHFPKCPVFPRKKTCNQSRWHFIILTRPLRHDVPVPDIIPNNTIAFLPVKSFIQHCREASDGIINFLNERHSKNCRGRRIHS
jgi:hypothetical protein